MPIRFPNREIAISLIKIFISLHKFAAIENCQRAKVQQLLCVLVQSLLDRSNVTLAASHGSNRAWMAVCSFPHGVVHL